MKIIPLIFLLIISHQLKRLVPSELRLLEIFKRFNFPVDPDEEETQQVINDKEKPFQVITDKEYLGPSNYQTKC